MRTEPLPPELLPLVSIIVPSFNQGRYIDATLRSILNQDYPNLEVLVFDGGSTDETLSILERYASRIKFISEPDGGQAAAVNRGFREAKGQIIGWLNSDDIYPDRRTISRIVDEFESAPESDIIYGDFFEIDRENLVLKAYRRPAFSFERLLRIGYISQPSTFMRRSVIEKLALREDLRYAMDTEFWLRAHRSGFRFRHCDAFVAAERLHELAKCVENGEEMAAEAQRVRTEYGANFDAVHKWRRFGDRVLLFALRLSCLLGMVSKASNRNNHTIDLNFEGVTRRTLSFSVH